jgi:peptidoglycan/LPS O-acetylase OafA/YrhL
MSTPELSLPDTKWSARSGLVPSLDGIRALSVSLVLLGHVLLPASLVGISALGLKTFFFISGFLITRLLLAEHKSNFRISLIGFYTRRVLRLYPVILVYVALVVSVSLARGIEVHAIDITSVFLYFVNYLVVHYDRLGQTMQLPVAMLWSLSVEEHFYLIAPLALVLCRGNAKKIIIVAISICVLSLCLRLFYAHISPGIVNGLELYWRSETRFDCIAFGVVLGCLPEIALGQRLIRALSSRLWFVAGCLLLIGSFLIRDNYFQLTWRFTLQSLALFPLMIGVIFSSPYAFVNRFLNNPLVVWVGALSYSLYVWHGGIDFLYGEQLREISKSLTSFIELSLALVMAVLSYYLIEQPVVRWRKKFNNRVKSNDQEKPLHLV